MSTIVLHKTLNLIFNYNIIYYKSLQYQAEKLIGETMHNLISKSRIYLATFLVYIIIFNIIPLQTTGSDNTTHTRSPDLTVEDSQVIYAIIAPDNFTSPLEPLAEWKTSKGVRAKIYTLEWINETYPGSDQAEQIHNFLAELDSHSANLTWLLLAGDTDLIPIREFYVNASLLYGLDDLYASDYYYAGLDSNWNNDGDELYGEQSKDLDPDANVYVGRLPINNSTELQIAVDNILKYERSPPAGNWYNNFTIWGGLMDAPNVFDNNDTPEDEGYNDYKDNGYKISQKILNYIPGNMTVKEFYDYPQLEGGSYGPDTDALNRTAAKTSYDEGNSLLNFAGQAYYTGDELAHYRNETGTMTDKAAFTTLYSYNNAKFSLNDGKLPLVYLSTCSVNFTEPYDSNMEQWLYAPDGGAIGVIANTGKSYRGETYDGNSYGNWWLNDRFWDLFFNDNLYRPGEALYELKSQYYDEVLIQDPQYPIMVYANIIGYNLLGDPEVPVWSMVPMEMEVDLPYFYINEQEPTVKVTDPSGSPVENARVCIMNSEVYSTGLTNSDGEAKLYMNAQNTGTLDITVTAHNYFPFESTSTIDTEPPDLVVDPLDLKLSNSTPSEGDNILVTIDVFNEGSLTANDIYVECYDGDPATTGIKIDDSKHIASINVGNYGTVKFEWNATHGNHTIFVVADPDDNLIESDEYNNKVSMSVYVNARPKLDKLPDINLSEDTAYPVSVYLIPYASDLDNNVTDLQFSISRVTNPKCNLSISTNSILLISIASNWYGMATATIEISDGLASSDRTFTINVAPSPDAPELDIIPDAKIDVGEKYLYFVEAEDPDGDKLTYTDDTKLFDIDPDSGRIAFTGDEDDVGKHTVTITVSDGNLTDSDSFTIEIKGGAGVENKLLSSVAILISIIIIIVILIIYLRQGKGEEPETGKEKKVTSKKPKGKKNGAKKKKPVNKPGKIKNSSKK
jgi:hypothetical protein